ncbi:MAG: GWxTD domain-containing protein, partial [Rhodothermales bacterium]|nr:GWxTD domain-containing protein [Rhodothermales bacterium]
LLRDALTYIATDDEMDRLRAATTPLAQKEAFDAFWGRNIADPNTAARTLERYFTRVEEANGTFSDFKEGWKTDRGMVYIVMGPPLYQEDSIEELRWFYSYDERNAGRYFVFDRVQGYPDELDMPHYVLKRSMEQEREWRLAVTRWRNGRAR